MGKRFGFFLVVFSISIWSLWPVLLRILRFSPFDLSIFIPFGSSVICIFLYPLKKPRGFKAFLGKMHVFVAVTFFLFFNTLFYFKALKEASIPVAVITHYTAPVFVALFSPLIIGEGRRRYIWLSIALSMVGISLALFSEFRVSSLKGGIFGLASGFFYGLGVVLTKGLLGAFDPYSYLYFASLLSVPLYFPLFASRVKIVGLGSVIWILPLSFLMSLAPAIMYLSGLKRLSAQSVSVLSYVEPILAIIWGFLFFGEGLTFLEVLGGILVFASSYLVIREEP